MSLSAADWFWNEEPVTMLRAFGPHRRTDRKMRLVAVAACRVALSGPVRADLHPAHVALAERLADGSADEAERLAAVQTVPPGTAARLLNWSGFQAGFQVLRPLDLHASDGLLRLPELPIHIGWGEHPKSDRARVCDAIRDIFGDPASRPRFDPDWRTDTAVELARSAYAADEFTNLPVLADALEDAGCDDPELLSHLRGPGPHVRGCWAVDLVLGLL